MFLVVSENEVVRRMLFIRVKKYLKTIGQTPGSVLLDFSGDPELAFSQFNHLSIVLMCW